MTPIQQPLFVGVPVQFSPYPTHVCRLIYPDDNITVKH